MDRIIEKDTPLFQVPDIPITDKEKTIAGYIVDMVPDGATIQIGIGGLPNAIGSFLTSKKDLGIHTEVMTKDRQHFSGQFAKRLFLIGPSATVQDIGLD